MEFAKVKVSLNVTGQEGTITINGVPIEGARWLKIEGGVEQVTTITLNMIADVEFDGEAFVEVAQRAPITDLDER